MNSCKKCGTEIEQNLLYCKKCKELKSIKTNKIGAIIFFIMFLIIFIVSSIISFSLSEVGSSLSGGNYESISFIDVIRLSSLNFIISGLPLIASMILSKKAKLNKLFILELIILFIAIICIIVN